MAKLIYVEKHSQLIHDIVSGGGEFLYVGGCVRDALLGLELKDYDIEVHGLSPETLEKILASYGTLKKIGKSFGVYKLRDMDICLPREDIKTHAGHKGFKTNINPFLSFKEAAIRRDLTINAIGYNPVSGELLDPFNGLDDLRSKTLREVSPVTFGEDPLRPLRVMQFMGRFGMLPTRGLTDLCRKISLEELPGERISEEFYKLLTKGSAPSLGLHFLKETGLLKFFPEMQALVGTLQNPEWHPEGDVWTHTLMVVDETSNYDLPLSKKWLISLSALCHDFGKPSSTRLVKDVLRSPNHEINGIPYINSFLRRLKVSRKIQKKVDLLTKYHFLPVKLSRGQVSRADIKRVSYELIQNDLSLYDLILMVKADLLGRKTKEAMRRETPVLDFFVKESINAKAFEAKYLKPCVSGADLLSNGVPQGAHMKKLLEAGYEYQLKSESVDKRKIISYIIELYNSE